MSYYPNADSDIRNKVNVVLDLFYYTTMKELEHATGIGTSDLATKKDFIALKAEVDNLDINKFVNVPTVLGDLKTKTDDLDDGKLKAVPIDLKNLSDAVGKKVQHTKYKSK